ncbi:MAG: hypothetical protein JWL70_2356 [Acidimicrobiia bacterium]|nr:hypothetical protein [Acidimicrobiia bacterium]
MYLHRCVVVAETPLQPRSVPGQQRQYERLVLLERGNTGGWDSYNQHNANRFRILQRMSLGTAGRPAAGTTIRERSDLCQAAQAIE